MNAGQNYVEIATVISNYFDGLYNSDSGLLAEVFHPAAQYVCVTDGSFVHLGMNEYLPMVEKRPSPASRGERRTDNIVSLEFAGPVTAFARVQCSIGEKFCTDLLTFIFLDGRWRIIAKVFHYDLRKIA